MFVIKFLAVAVVMYIAITTIIPTAIGAYYGCKLWKKYSSYTTIPKETVNEWFQTDLELHLINNAYIRFINRF